MSTALARRLDRMEDAHFAAAITRFADSCRRVFDAPAALFDAALAAVPEGAEDTPFTLALWPVIALTTSHPTDQSPIRAALAAVAPFVGLTPSASPLAIFAALEDVLTVWEREAQG
jgi:xanthine/CO dehydrogenase XdhC/CoxF family maturation factor